jgi:hypothetical protein
MENIKKERGVDFHWGQSGHSGPSCSPSPALGAGPGPHWEPSGMPSPSPAGPGLTGSSAALTALMQSIVKVNIATIAITLISFFIFCTATSLLVLKDKE